MLFLNSVTIYRIRHATQHPSRLARGRMRPKARRGRRSLATHPTTTCPTTHDIRSKPRNIYIYIYIYTYIENAPILLFPPHCQSCRIRDNNYMTHRCPRNSPGNTPKRCRKMRTSPPADTKCNPIRHPDCKTKLYPTKCGLSKY